MARFNVDLQTQLEHRALSKEHRETLQAHKDMQGLLAASSQEKKAALAKAAAADARSRHLFLQSIHLPTRACIQSAHSTCQPTHPPFCTPHTQKSKPP
jgi:hypothetical protein